MYLFGGICPLGALFILNTGPDVGWFAYVPLRGPRFAPGKRADIWAQMITFTELSALCVAVEIVVTVFNMRAPGMSLNRIPMFAVGAGRDVAFMVIFAMPAIMLSSTMLLLDRMVQHAFLQSCRRWRCAALPAPLLVFRTSRGLHHLPAGHGDRLNNHRSLLAPTCFRVHGACLSMVATGFIGFGVWVHHMFATGLPQLSESFFTAASLMIVIPTGVQFFCWMTTLCALAGCTCACRCCGFSASSLCSSSADLTGVMLASVPVDLQVHDTFFIVAHFHYVLIGGAVFPLFGGILLLVPEDHRTHAE